jgi:hypothetical protein
MVSSSQGQTCLVRRPGDVEETVEVHNLVPGTLQNIIIFRLIYLTLSMYIKFKVQITIPIWSLL